MERIFLLTNKEHFRFVVQKKISTILHELDSRFS